MSIDETQEWKELNNYWAKADDCLHKVNDIAHLEDANLILFNLGKLYYLLRDLRDLIEAKINIKIDQKHQEIKDEFENEFEDDDED